MKFTEELEVYYRGLYGKIRFVCDEYLTICVRKSNHKSKDVCVLVYPNQYHQISLIKESTK